MRYAYVLDHENYRDLVHNAYLYYYKKSSGGNLFADKPEPYILRCVKFMWKWNMSNTVIGKNFIEYYEAASEFGDNPSYSDMFNAYSDPLRNLESEEAVDLITKRVAAYHSGGLSSVGPQELLQVMDYLQRGYTGNEIGTMMDISFQTVSNHKKKIQKLIGKTS